MRTHSSGLLGSRKLRRGSVLFFLGSQFVFDLRDLRRSQRRHKLTHLP